MGTTTAHGLPIPDLATDNCDFHAHLGNLANGVENNFTPKFTAGSIWAYFNSSQTVGSDLVNPALLNLDTVVGTPAGFTLNTSTHVITPSFSGSCFFTAGVQFSETGSSRVFSSVFINGTEALRGLDLTGRGLTTGDLWGSVLPGQVYQVNSGDSITLRALHTGPSASLAPGKFVTWLRIDRRS